MNEHPQPAPAKQGELLQIYKPISGSPMRVAAFLSGTGSNLRKILEFQKELERNNKKSFEVTLIYSDTSDENTCKAKTIANEFGIPYFCSDISEYYHKRGYADRKDMGVRREYDRQVAQLLKQYRVQIVALCGYMSIVTEEIYGHFLTVNVHPADLRLLDGTGKRLYAGCMGAGCVRKVMSLAGKEIRSTTHLVTGDVDGGPILLVSEPVKLEGSQAPEDYFQKLKERGDFVIYPQTLHRLAEGRFWIDREEHFVIDIAREKELLRENMKRIREKISPEDIEQKSKLISEQLLRLPSYASARTILAYMAKGKEVSTRAIIAKAIADGKKIVLPVTDLSKQQILPTTFEGIEDLKEGPFDILEPQQGRPVDPQQIDFVLLPGIAFDPAGNRIGYGLGFYDRFLTRINPKTKRAALAFEIQVVDRIRSAEHDMRVNYIITEEKIINCDEVEA